ncbi:MinD/ParA family ATP-binding protein [Halopelagius fulvigenes]|uniref:MinD/ParA family protein n=1 Tax=Halopelagius fulvigenes TaxID=1198324 RepID=A0ABD5TXM7_9EURY
MLAIAGGKGGCGKTTTTLGLAAAMDAETRVVDADRDMPNLHALAGVPRDATERTAADGRVPSDPADERTPPYRHPEYNHVSVSPAPPRRDARADGGCDDPSARLRRIRAETDAAVLVDCPAGAGPDAAAPLRVCDGAVVVSSLCAPSLRDAAKTASMARTLGTPVVGAVLTRARVAPPGVSDLLGCPVLGRVPEAEPPVLEDASVRRAYENVATEIQAAEGII